MCNDLSWKYTSPLVTGRYNSLRLPAKNVQGVFDQDNITMTDLLYDWPTMKSTTPYQEESSSIAMADKDVEKPSDNSKNRSITAQTENFIMVVAMAVLTFIVQFI